MRGTRCELRWAGGQGRGGSCPGTARSRSTANFSAPRHAQLCGKAACPASHQLLFRSPPASSAGGGAEPRPCHSPVTKDRFGAHSPEAAPAQAAESLCPRLSWWKPPHVFSPKLSVVLSNNPKSGFSSSASCACLFSASAGSSIPRKRWPWSQSAAPRALPCPSALLAPRAPCPLGQVASFALDRQASPSFVPGWLLALPRGMVPATAAGKITNTTHSHRHRAGKSRGLEAPAPDHAALWAYAALGVPVWEHGPARASLPPSVPPTSSAGAGAQHRALSRVRSSTNTRGASHAEPRLGAGGGAAAASLQPTGEPRAASPPHRASSPQKCLSSPHLQTGFPKTRCGAAAGRFAMPAPGVCLRELQDASSAPGKPRRLPLAMQTW